MLMRHFGHGIGHLKYKTQQEPEPEIDPRGIPRVDGNQDDNNTSKTEESEEEGDINSEEPRSGGDPVADKDDSSDGENEEIEYSDSGSNSGEGDDDRYASL